MPHNHTGTSPPLPPSQPVRARGTPPMSSLSTPPLSTAPPTPIAPAPAAPLPLLPSLPDKPYASDALPPFAQRAAPPPFIHALTPLAAVADKHPPSHHAHQLQQQHLHQQQALHQQQQQHLHQQQQIQLHQQQLHQQQQLQQPHHSQQRKSEQMQWPSPNRMSAPGRVFPRPQFAIPLSAKISAAEEKLRFSPFLPEVLAEMGRQNRSPAAVLDVDDRLHVPGRKKDDNIITSYGFPKTDQDVDYCLEDTPGLSPANFNTLKSSLLHNLAQVRQAAHECASDMESILAQQIAFRVLPALEFDRRMQFVVGRFSKARKQILHKYRGYVRNRRWIENVATRQRRGCLTHRQNNILRLWLFTNFSNPYPDASDKRMLIQQTGLSMTQINNWLINARSRVWKPTVETMSGERIRRDMTAREELKMESRMEARVDFKTDLRVDPDFAAPSPENAHVSHASSLAINPIASMSASVPGVGSHAAQANAPVETLGDDGNWLGPQSWGGLDFSTDVQLTSQLQG